MFEERGGLAAPPPIPDQGSGPGHTPAGGPIPTVMYVAGLDADGCLTLMTTLARDKARLDALMIHTQARFNELRPPDSVQRAFSDFAADEVAVVLDLSLHNATNQMYLAHALTSRLPATLTALEAGAIDLARARAVAEATTALSDEQAAAVEAKVLAGGRRGSHTLFRQALRRAVLTVDPDGARRRHTEARRERQVRIHPHDDGMTELWALLPAADAQAAYQRIDALARRAATPDDARGIDERRADVLADLILGRGHPQHGVHVEIGVIVPATTLLGLTDTPGELAGYGPIGADLARELAKHATLRRLLTDPVDGSLLELGERRFPSPALARHVRARDRMCVFPACRKPANACDLDHVRAHADGGETNPANLATLCRHHHRMKHEGGWRLEQPRPGHFTWTTPENRVYHAAPEPYLDSTASTGQADPTGHRSQADATIDRDRADRPSDPAPATAPDRDDSNPGSRQDSEADSNSASKLTSNRGASSAAGSKPDWDLDLPPF